MSNGTKQTATKKKEPEMPDTKEETAMVATSPAPLVQRPQGEDLSEYGEYMGQGHEDRRNEDNRVPMLYLLQPLSSRVKDRTQVERADAGMLWDTSANKLYDCRDNPILMLPIAHRVTYVEWIVKNKDGSGGGFVSRYAHDDKRIARDVSDASNKFKKIPFAKGVDGKCEDPKGTELCETIELTGVFLLEDEWTPWVFPLTGIKIGDWRKWYNEAFPSHLPDGRLPEYSQLVHLTTWPNDKKQGAWSIHMKPAMGDRVKSRLKPSDPRFQYGAEFYKAAFGKDATIKIDHNAGYAQQAAAAATESVDIPF
jgi:hypothetical protein